MTELDLNLKLTNPNPNFARKVARTHKGMAHFAGTGPARQTCRTCLNWNGRGKEYYSKGSKYGPTLKPQRCLQYSRMMAGQHGHEVPHSATACKYHEANPDAPPVKEPQS